MRIKIKDDMNHQNKARQAILQRFDAKRKATRKPNFYDPAIILGKKGGLTRKKINQIEERLRKKVMEKEGKEINKLKSTDNVLMRKGLKVTSTDLAARMLTKYFMRPFLIQNKLSHNQIKALEAIIRNRTRVIKGTNIQLSPNLTLLLLKFSNTLGENGYKKAKELSKLLTERGKSLSKMIKKSRTISDMFYNVYPRVATTEQFLNQPPEIFAKDIRESIIQRMKDLEQLNKINMPQKERYVKQIETEIKEAKENYILFRQNNFF